jgi:linoleate 10R-lipoxygenase
MYRWHACVSAPDTAWLENELRTLFPAKRDALGALTREDLRGAVRGRGRPAADVTGWTFGGCVCPGASCVPRCGQG